MNENIDQNIQSSVPLQGAPMPPFAPMPPMNGAPIFPRRMNVKTAAKALFPKWLGRNAIIVYFASLAVVTFMYSAHSLPWYYILSGIVSVMVFFLYSTTVAQDTSLDKMRKERNFEKRIFLIAFAARAIWMILIFTIFMQTYSNAFGFENADAIFYDSLGQDFADAIGKGNFIQFFRKLNEDIDLSDLGNGAYVGFIYWLTGSKGVSTTAGTIGGENISIFILRLIKCVWSSLTVLLIYRLAKRNFGEQIARMAAIFVALWPNFWYYCGCNLKEAEMTFLGVLFVEQADQMLRSRQFTAWKIGILILIAMALLTFRTPLALVALLSLLFSVTMSSSRIVNWGKRIVLGILAAGLIGVTMGNVIEEQAQGLMNTVKSGEQEENMEWRTKRENGNSFAKYAGKSVFAPLIFTIPFPSMVRPFDGQEQQQLLNGGNFVKNIMSAFTIFAMFTLLFSGKWREHLLPLSFMLGYLVVLTMSTFAQSERFHQPVMPFEFMFAAYGLSIAVTKKKYKRWFTYWCGAMFVITIAWSWFKMAGRGLS